MVVQGAVNPDEFYVHKPTLKACCPAVVRKTLGSKLIKMTYSEDACDGRQVKIVDTSEAERNRFCITDEEVMALAKQALIIEQHYGRPMDIEWAKDGQDGQLYIVQARPETVRSRQEANTLERFALKQSGGKVLIEGRAIGHKIGSGPARVISSISQMDEVQPGDVLVTDMTDPDWEPIMKRASAIVTNRAAAPATPPSLPVSSASRPWWVVATPPLASRRVSSSPSPAPKGTPASSTTVSSTSRWR